MSGENMAKKMGQGKQIRGALERLDSIEELLPQMMTQINRAVTVLENNIQSLNEIVEAVVVCVGEEQVDAALLRIRTLKAEADAEAARSNLQKAVAEKKLVPAESVSEASIVVGVETDKDGKAVPPGRVQFNSATLTPEYREKLIGQRLGFKFSTGDANTVEITEIYVRSEPVPQS